MKNVELAREKNAELGAISECTEAMVYRFSRFRTKSSGVRMGKGLGFRVPIGTSAFLKCTGSVHHSSGTAVLAASSGPEVRALQLVVSGFGRPRQSEAMPHSACATDTQVDVKTLLCRHVQQNQKAPYTPRPETSDLESVKCPSGYPGLSGLVPTSACWRTP